MKNILFLLLSLIITNNLMANWFKLYNVTFSVEPLKIRDYFDFKLSIIDMNYDLSSDASFLKAVEDFSAEYKSQYVMDEDFSIDLAQTPPFGFSGKVLGNLEVPIDQQAMNCLLNWFAHESTPADQLYITQSKVMDAKFLEKMNTYLKQNHPLCAKEVSPETIEKIKHMRGDFLYSVNLWSYDIYPSTLIEEILQQMFFFIEALGKERPKTYLVKSLIDKLYSKGLTKKDLDVVDRIIAPKKTQSPSEFILASLGSVLDTSTILSLINGQEIDSTTNTIINFSDKAFLHCFDSQRKVNNCIDQKTTMELNPIFHFVSDRFPGKDFYYFIK